MTEYWPVTLAILERGIAVWASAHAILYKRETRAVIGWVGLIWLVPLIGSLAYYGLGINRVRRQGGKYQEDLDEAMASVNASIPAWEKKRLEEARQEYPQYAQHDSLMRELTGRPLLPGNQVEPLPGGDKAFPAMLEAIRQAKKSVVLETYIFDADRAGLEFVDALEAAQQRGVEVRVLIDDLGSRYSRPSVVHLLRKRKIRCRTFLPTRALLTVSYANLRNHRKILVVDGRIGFTGGMNIREGCRLDWNPAHPIQDMHFRIEGPVVSHLQEAFAADWAFTTKEVLSGEDWFPPTEAAGTTYARGILDGPDKDFEKLLITIQGAITVAQKSLTIFTPYFLPEPATVSALNIAAMRGVEVRIVLPEENNIRLVQWASMAMLWQVLERGCQIYLSPPPFDHTKLMLVDGAWTLIGSTNWDPRSLRLNFEFNVECYDFFLCEQLEAFAEEKIQASRKLTLEDVNNRSLPVKLRDGIARLATPYL